MIDVKGFIQRAQPYVDGKKVDRFYEILKVNKSEDFERPLNAVGENETVWRRKDTCILQEEDGQ